MGLHLTVFVFQFMLLRTVWVECSCYNSTYHVNLCKILCKYNIGLNAPRMKMLCMFFSFSSHKMFSLQCPKKPTLSLSLSLLTRTENLKSIQWFHFVIISYFVYNILLGCVRDVSLVLPKIAYSIPDVLGIYICCLASQYKTFKRKICIYSGMWHECVCI